MCSPFWLHLGKGFFGRPFEEEELKKATENFWKELATLEVYLGQHEGNFIVNNEPTIADIQLFSDFTAMFNARLDKDFEESSKYPRVKVWRDSMLTIPGVKQVDEKWMAEGLP